MRIAIIDPTSPEFNRGSFCYLPYILFSALKDEGHDVILYEDFTAVEIDLLPEFDEYYVACWSYPQIELNKVLQKNLPLPPKFFGYDPLLKQEGLLPFGLDDKVILKGLETYHLYYDQFKTILLSDCDMHLTKYHGQVYPLFTSYGCPKGCAFCPSTVNCNQKRLILDLERVKDSLRSCHSRGIKNIHFTDEDFFFSASRAKDILEFAEQLGGFNFIALGSVHAVLNFQKQYPGLLRSSGVRLVEVGFETADEELSKSMGKPSLVYYEQLAEICEIDVFWLTLTFFPGETIKTLGETGDFLSKYGFKLDELYGRVRTNGTQGGLGQFFQLYHGTKDFDSLGAAGIVLSPRPLRLIPSFIPNSFLDCKVQNYRAINTEDIQWFDLYKVSANLCIKKDKTIRELMELNSKICNFSDAGIFFAICARLKIIV